MAVLDRENNTCRILSSGDVARYCGVHFRTVIRWIEKGSLKAYKLPGRGNNRIEERDFLEFLSTNNLPVPPEFKKANKRILIVDDDHAMASAMQRVLKRSGFETQVAHDGFSAGSMLANFEPVLMILDLSMPGMSGFDVLDFIGQDKNYKYLKVLVVSALEDGQLQRAKRAGANDCLSKPFDNKHLLQKVSELSNQAINLV